MTLAAWAERAVWVAAIVIFGVTFVRFLNSPAVDFAWYYHGATAIRTGQPLYATALDKAARGYAEGLPNVPEETSAGYVYPPLMAVVLAPLSALPITSASLIWYLVLCASLPVTAYVLADMYTASRPSARWTAAAAILIWLLLFKPVRGALGFTSQVDILVVMLLALSLRAFLRRHDISAGAWLGVAIAIKPFCVILAVFLLWKAGWRAFVVAGCVAAALVLPLLWGLGQFNDYLTVTAHWSGPTFTASPVSQSFTSVLQRLFTVTPFTQPAVDAPWLVTPLRIVLSLIVVVALAPLIRRQRGTDPIEFALEFAVAISLMLLLAPLLEETYLAYLAIGLPTIAAAALTRARVDRRAVWVGLAFLAATGLMLTPGLHELSWGFWRFNVEPLRFPFSLVTGVFLCVYLAVAALVAVTLVWWRRSRLMVSERPEPAPIPALSSRSRPLA